MTMAARGFPPQLLTDTRSYLARFATTKPSMDVATAIDRYLITTLKNEGLWSTSWLWPFFADGDLAGLKKEARAGVLSWTDESGTNPMYFTPYFGAQSDGTASMTLGTNAAGIGYGLTAHWALLVISTDDQTGGGAEWGTFGGGTFLDYQARNGNVAKFGPGGNARISFTATSGVGIQGYVREDANGGFYFFNGIYNDWVTTDDTLPTANIKLGRSGAASSRSTNNVVLLIHGTTAPSKSSITNINNAILSMIAALGIDFTVPPAPVPGPNWFAQTLGSAMTPAKRVYRTYRKPTPSEAKSSYAAYPVDVSVTAFTTVTGDSNVGALNSVWSSHPTELSPGVPVAKVRAPNKMPGGAILVTTTLFGRTVVLQAAFEYSSDARAMAADQVQVSYACGHDARNSAADPDGKGWLDRADDGGYDTSGWASYLSDPTSLYTNVDISTGDVFHRAHGVAHGSDIFTQLPSTASQTIVCTDKIMLQALRQQDDPNAIGIWLDFEKQVGSDPTATVAHLRKLAAIAHGKSMQLVVFTNPLHTTGTLNGIVKASAYQILQSGGPDKLFIVVAGGTGTTVQFQLDSQWNILTGPLSDQTPDVTKLGVQCLIGISSKELSASDAAAAAAWAEAKGIVDCYFFPQYATTGGPPTNAMNRDIGNYCHLALS